MLAMESSDSENLSNSTGENITQTPAEASKEEKLKLRKEIQELQELNFQIECRLNISKFGDIKHLLKYPEPALHEPPKRVPDVEVEYIDQLLQLAGLHCTKFVVNEHVFSFSSSGNLVRNDAYAVQITNATEKPKVGKWVMPMSVDMDGILLETPLETTMDLKLFLINCKHHIDCYTNRVQQYNQLQLIISDLSGCWLDCNLGYTVIILEFFDIEDLDSQEMHNVKLYLVYESDRVRPHKFKIDPLNSKTLADAVIDKLMAYFKYFKCYDLKKAFKETIAAEDTPVVWRKGEDRDALDLNDSSASSSGANFITKGKRNRRKSTSRGLKRKVADTSLRSNESANQEQGSIDSDSQRADDPDQSLLHSVDKRGEKLFKNKGKRLSPRKKQIQEAEASQKKTKPKKKPNKNVEFGANASKTTLRQDTLKFQKKRPGEVDRAQLNDDVPLRETISSAGTSTMRQKSKSNRTLLKNHEFGTSTPLLHREKKRFSADNITAVSPIMSKETNTGLKKKQLLKSAK